MFYYDKLNDWFEKLKEKTQGTPLWDLIVQCDELALENDCSSEQFWINVMEQSSVDKVVADLKLIDDDCATVGDFVFKYI